MEQKKNLCAQVPLSLHAQICEAREAAGQTTSEYITSLLIEYYNLKKSGGKTTLSGNTRTMAFQIPEKLFQRIKAHLEREALNRHIAAAPPLCGDAVPSFKAAQRQPTESQRQPS